MKAEGLGWFGNRVSLGSSTANDSKHRRSRSRLQLRDSELTGGMGWIGNHLCLPRLEPVHGQGLVFGLRTSDGNDAPHAKLVLVAASGGGVGTPK